jgi:nucleoside-diphosphate-sugar epimerase
MNANQKPTISILGCGWYGMALGRDLVKKGYAVKGSTTSINKLPVLQANGIDPYLINFEVGTTLFDARFFDCEILIISIPPKRNSLNLSNYPTKIAAIASAAKDVKHILFISSSGVYQDGNFSVDETIVPDPASESGKVMFAAEEVLRKNPLFTATIIRFAGLIGPDRTLTKHLAGKEKIANGLAPINLIHLTDCIGLTEAIIEQRAFGKIYHGVTPHHPTRADFYIKNCLAHRMAKPDFINELLTWKIIESVNVPRNLNYRYQIKDWDKWLKSSIE